MWRSVLAILARGLELVNKLVPGWEWKGGKATAERDQLEKDLGDVETGRRARESVRDPDNVRRLRDKYRR